MTVTFDPAPAFTEAMAAFDKAEQACEPTVMDIITDLEIADLIDELGNRGIAVLVANQKAWRESAAVSGVDPRTSWAEVAIDGFFLDREKREVFSDALKAGA
ncbi:MAG: hypothetical protein ACRDTI_17990 [Mycobacterium sp.]